MKLTTYLKEEKDRYVLIICADKRHLAFVWEKIMTEITDAWGYSQHGIVYNYNRIFLATELMIKTGFVRGCSFDLVLVTTDSIFKINPDIMNEIGLQLKKEGEVFFYEP